MMKRVGVARLATSAPDDQPPLIIATTPQIQQQVSVTGVGVSVSGHAQPPPVGLHEGPSPHPTTIIMSTQQVINYSKSTTGGQYVGAPYAATPAKPGPPHVRHKAGSQSPGSVPITGGAQFQRLKVEDALSYLDQVKFKFNNQPQVYNDFLDIMKEFKSQSIDTPGVIARVSNLFKGHPELIVGFNTFLPPGYKIEVQPSDQGYSYQVSVSMPSPTSLLPHQQSHNNVSHGQVLSGTSLLVGPPQPLPAPQHHQQHHLLHIMPPTPTPTNTLHHISQAHQQLEAPAPPHTATASQPVEFNHAIEYVNKIKSRFNRQPEKYKRFLEILHAYQRGQKELKEPHVKQQTEQEVYAQVAKLFENQDDLLQEFGQFLPDATSGGGIGGAAATAALVAARPPEPPPARPRPPTQAPPLQREAETDSPYRPSQAPSPGYAAEAALPPAPSPAPPPPAPAQAHLKHSTAPPHPTHPPHPSHPPHTPHPPQQHLKRSPSFGSANQLGSVGPPPKKHKYTPRDVTYAEAAKYGSLSDIGFFDKVRKALRSQEVYDNFLRCLLLFTNEVVSKSELLMVVAPFLTRHQDLQRWLQDFLGPIAPASPGPASPPSNPQPLGNGTPHHPYTSLSQGYGQGLYSGERYTGDTETLGMPGALLRQDRPQGDAAMEVDLTTCKRLGTSYCALPRGSAESAARRCSGRTQICRDVLNDSWVSFPTWAEDSTFVTSRKTQYEEYIYRCEDERFELDVVIETNASTILALEGVHKKICRMGPDEAARYRLDDCLGGSSPTIHQRALRRIYGDKAPDIISGLKKNPLVAVPVVLRRLKAKEEEWREAQKGFNKQWREQNEKYYLKSLDHQGINFKQNDLKALRSKSLFNEIETIYDERRDQLASSMTEARGSGGPHLSARCGPGGAALLGDAADLLIHHVRRQTAIQKQEKQRIKQLLRHFLPDLFCHPRMPLSDDERDDDDKELDVALDSPGSGADDIKAGSPEPDLPQSAPVVKQEREGSSESDTATSGGRAARREEKTVGRENKENLKGSTVGRNNSADSADAKDNPPSSKSSESSGGGKPGRRRDTSPDCGTTGLPSLGPESSGGTGGGPVVFWGSGQWYVFLRLHAVLCQRLASMKALAARLAAEEAGEARLRRPAVAVALRLKPDNTLPVSQYYCQLLEMVRSVLDGNTEASCYEDGLREMFGIHAYVAFTLDKVVSYAVRQLQQCVQERTASRCVELHVQERNRGVGGPAAAAAHQRRAERLLREDQAFKICIFGGEECRVTFELMESGGGSGAGGASGSPPPAPPAAPARLAEWARYRERYANPALAPDLPLGLFKDGKWCGRKAVFLGRNVRDSQRLHGTPNGDLSPHLAARDHTEGRFALASYKMVFVVNREQFLYKKDALTRARKHHKEVSLRLDTRWRTWLRGWCARHVSPAAARSTQEWLRRGVRAVASGSTDRPPYAPYTRYRLDTPALDR